MRTDSETNDSREAIAGASHAEINGISLFEIARTGSPPETPQKNISLDPSYAGPVLLTTVAGTLIDKNDGSVLRGQNGGPVSGSSEMLAKVEAEGVPLVYVSNDDSAVKGLPSGIVISPEKLEALRKEMPQSKISSALRRHRQRRLIAETGLDSKSSRS